MNFTLEGDFMFLSSEQIQKLGFDEKDLESCTVKLHVSKYLENGKEIDFKGDSLIMGGYEYPRHMTFITEEEMNLDNGTVGLIFGRQSYAIKSVLVFPGIVHPGYNKKLLLQVVCLGPQAIIRKGDPIAYIAFAQTDSKTNKPIDLDETWVKSTSFI